MSSPVQLRSSFIEAATELRLAFESGPYDNAPADALDAGRDALAWLDHAIALLDPEARLEEPEFTIEEYLAELASRERGL